MTRAVRAPSRALYPRDDRAHDHVIEEETIVGPSGTPAQTAPDTDEGIDDSVGTEEGDVGFDFDSGEDPLSDTRDDDAEKVEQQLEHKEDLLLRP